MSAVSRILLVEDDASARNFLVAVLAHYIPDANIIIATNGEAALAVHTQTPADIIITDYIMPLMSGLDLIIALRTQQETTPIVMISGDYEVWKTALAAGATIFLEKPIQTDDLIAAVTSLMPR